MCIDVAGVCHNDLQNFLDANLPKSSKKQKSLLGISDSKLAAAISESLNVSCMHTGVVPEIIRGEKNAVHRLQIYLHVIQRFYSGTCCLVSHPKSVCTSHFQQVIKPS